jgi:hypothetical protein
MGTAKKQNARLREKVNIAKDVMQLPIVSNIVNNILFSLVALWTGDNH